MSMEKYHPSSEQELEREAREWDSGARSPRAWIDAPDAVPRAGAATPISLRVPVPMLRILKAFAERQGVGYQVLIKRWLDERIRAEWDRLAANQKLVRQRPVRVADSPSRGEEPVLGGLPEDEARFVRELVGFLREKARNKKNTGGKQGRNITRA
ncbi:MAG: hypothetical protein HY673_09090 [Chloroflexi bacterium]|nr:hypothetical protein [Chloroflexota bacterium]